MRLGFRLQLVRLYSRKCAYPRFITLLIKSTARTAIASSQKPPQPLPWTASIPTFDTAAVPRPPRSGTTPEASSSMTLPAATLSIPRSTQMEKLAGWTFTSTTMWLPMFGAIPPWLRRLRPLQRLRLLLRLSLSRHDGISDEAGVLIRRVRVRDSRVQVSI